MVHHFTCTRKVLCLSTRHPTRSEAYESLMPATSVLSLVTPKLMYQRYSLWTRMVYQHTCKRSKTGKMGICRGSLLDQ